MNYLTAFAAIAVALRLITLWISVRNERTLRAEGALESGAANSRLLAFAHIAFYVSAMDEGLRSEQSTWDAAGLAGLVSYSIGMVSLALVIKALGRQWTVKLLVSPRHVWVRTGIYRYARHPNYYLNILPELVGFALVMHAHRTLLIGVPLYAVPLWFRIQAENQAMKRKFANYML